MKMKSAVLTLIGLCAFALTAPADTFVIHLKAGTNTYTVSRTAATTDSLRIYLPGDKTSLYVAAGATRTIPNGTTLIGSNTETSGGSGGGGGGHQIHGPTPYGVTFTFTNNISGSKATFVVCVPGFTGTLTFNGNETTNYYYSSGSVGLDAENPAGGTLALGVFDDLWNHQECKFAQ